MPMILPCTKIVHNNAYYVLPYIPNLPYISPIMQQQSIIREQDQNVGPLSCQQAHELWHMGNACGVLNCFVGLS